MIKAVRGGGGKVSYFTISVTPYRDKNLHVNHDVFVSN